MKRSARTGAGSVLAAVVGLLYITLLLSSCGANFNLEEGDLPPGDSGGWIMADMTNVSLAEAVEDELFFCAEKGLWGLIDKEGNLAVEPQYVRDDWDWELEGFHAPGYFLMDQAGYYHRLDEKGQEVWDYTGFMKELQEQGLEYSHDSYLGGFLVTTDEGLLFYNYEEQQILENPVEEFKVCVFDMGQSYKELGFYAIQEKGKMGAVDLEGRRLLSSDYDDIGAGLFYEEGNPGVISGGYITAVKDGKWGIYDGAGKELAAPRFDSILGDVDGIFVYRNGERYGYMSRDGQLLTEAVYDMPGWYSQNGLRAVRKDGKWGLVDEDFQAVIAFQYDDIRLVEEHILVRKGAKEDVLDENLQPTYGFHFDAMYRQLKDGHIVEYDSRYGLINKEGGMVLPAEYFWLEEIGPDCFLSSRYKGRWSIITADGETIYEYQRRSDYQIDAGRKLDDERGCMVVKDEDGCGILLAEEGLEPRWILPVEMEWIQENYSDRDPSATYLFAAKGNDGGLWLVDHDMEARRVGTFDDVKKSSRLIPFSGGDTKTVFTVLMDGRWGAVNDKGQVVIPFEYDDMGSFNRFGYVAVMKDGKWGSLNFKGEVMVEPTYILDYDEGWGPEYQQHADPQFLRQWYLASKSFYVAAYTTCAVESEAFGE